MALDRPPWSLVLALCLGYFLILLDVTVVNVALPQINSDLRAGASGLAWIVDGYSVPLAALLLAAGAVGDRLGHRRIVVLGMIVFGAASVACALAPTMGVLIAARAGQGAGAALMLPGTLAMLVERTPDAAARTRLVGIWAAIGGAALPAGPVVGGVLVQTLGWRAVFWLAVPFIVLALVPVLRAPRGTSGSVSGRVDVAGAVLLVAALAGVVSAIITAPDDVGVAGGLAVAAVVAGTAFVVVERRARYPLISVSRQARSVLAQACGVAALMNLATLGGLFLLTQVFQDVHHRSPLVAGLAMLPAMAPLPLLGAPAGRLSARIGAWRTSSLGLLVGAVGFGGMAIGIVGDDLWVLVVSLAVWGAGLGILTPAIVAAALQAVPGSPGTASGASNTSRQTGGALGVAIFATVAGPAGAAQFVSHSAGLFLGAGLAFALTGGWCLALHRRV
ncbi:MFS transporter [Gordonia sp. DT219]|uniref:MFS transporter n=1 Tax=Gordonia sp. DT219 TaxID=3416658 RepID=UPI003CF023C5